MKEAPNQKIQLDHLSDWQQRFSGVREETNAQGLAQHQIPIIVQLTRSAVRIQIKQYPVTLETKGEIAVFIAWLGETGIVVFC